MSNEEDADERQYVRKYYKMAKQFDELIEAMDARTAQLKRRRVSSTPRKGNANGGGGGNNGGAPCAGGSGGRAAAVRGKSGKSRAAAASVGQLDHNDLLVQTINRHLEDLRNDNPIL